MGYVDSSMPVEGLEVPAMPKNMAKQTNLTYLVTPYSEVVHNMDYVDQV